ncbi:hypothetical protein HHI36_012967 [Cryptolaemus montrouzieri]|uniref:Uncharacterized protein n=1 Tax=Cryptolaemus montrouzieri TaxID=559131 RepID=A0ABD2NFR5_9CUCU
MKRKRRETSAAMLRETFSSLDCRPRYLETVREEVIIADQPVSRLSRLSRSNSARQRSSSTPRPRWRY